MKLLAAALFVAMLLLQGRIWLSSQGVRSVYRLERAVAMQAKLDRRLQRRNARLAAEVADLESGTGAIEERARSELGMIGPHETFYMVVEPPHFPLRTGH
jgi:cell division protein FtsB